jgi:apolipoprotein N-acyltransferase
MVEQAGIGSPSSADLELAQALENARRRRRTRIAGALAFAFVVAFFAIHLEWQDRTVGLPLAASYFAAYSLVPLVFASIIGGIACVIRGRSWFRFFVTFSIVSALGMPSQLSQLAKHSKEELRGTPRIR